jgi:hypothetical protein
MNGSGLFGVECHISAKISRGYWGIVVGEPGDVATGQGNLPPDFALYLAL